jgi:hypothetical protein
VTESGWTALHYAALRGHALVVRALLSLSGGDVDVNARIAGTGMTAMHLAASAGHASSVLEMTRERRTNISATDHQGWTPLHMACRWNHVLVAGVLINNSRTLIASRTRHGWTPFQLAFEEGNDRIVRMLVEQERAVLAHRMRLASESATRHAALLDLGDLQEQAEQRARDGALSSGEKVERQRLLRRCGTCANSTTHITRVAVDSLSLHELRTMVFYKRACYTLDELHAFVTHCVQTSAIEFPRRCTPPRVRWPHMGDSDLITEEQQQQLNDAARATTVQQASVIIATCFPPLD